MNLEKIIENILEKMLLGTETTTQNKISFIGQYVIVRGNNAGVRSGKLIQDTLGSIVLEDARMLRYRWAKKGTGLSSLALFGLADNKEVKINATITKVMITDMGVSTFLPCTAEVEKQIRGYAIA